MKAVFMAGGRGSRISSMVQDIPKPMIRIADKPILQYGIENLKGQGIEDFIITVSYKSEIIKSYFGDGSDLGVNITYYEETEPLGNAGAIFKIRDQLTEDFIFLVADAVFDIDLSRFIRVHDENKRHGGVITIFTHPNSHPYDSGLVITDERHAVTQLLAKEDERPDYYKNRVNAGIHIISPEALYMASKKVNASVVDLDRQIIKPLIPDRVIYAYDSPEYIKDMGTPERYHDVSEDVKSGVVKARNLSNKQRAVFIDRDGTINKYVGLLTRLDDMELLSGVGGAIKKINASGYLAVIVTNQPVVARGDVTVEELDQIHNKMETLLGKKGAYIDALYYCPHHPDRGFEGEVVSLKVDCECRKPKAGMLYRAARDLNIDLSSSWMIGDSERDVTAGHNAGCQTAYISRNKDNVETEDYGQDMTVSGLAEFVDRLLEKN